MRWQPLAVSAGLLAPPVLLAAVVWPEEGLGAGRGDGIEAELSVGDTEAGTTNGFTSTDFLVVGPGELRIDVDGPGWDPTLTLLDPDSGEQLAYNDDFEDLNPSLTVQLDDGESVRAQVRSLNGPPGGRFEISVRESVGGDAVDVGAGGGVDPGGGPIGGLDPSSATPGDPVGELVVGQAVEGETDGDPTTTYLLVGPGEFRIDVAGPEFDPTLVLYDVDTLEQRDFNDDSGGGFDPSLQVSLGDEEVLVGVGTFAGSEGGTYTITVSDALAPPVPADPGSAPGGPPTTIVAP